MKCQVSFRTKNLSFRRMPDNNLDFFVNFEPGADLRFSRGGGADFQKTVENFVDRFLGRPN